MPYQETEHNLLWTLGHPQCTPTLKAQEILYHGRGGRNIVRVRGIYIYYEIASPKTVGKTAPMKSQNCCL